MKAIQLPSALLVLSILPILPGAQPTPAQEPGPEPEVSLPLPTAPAYALPAAPLQTQQARRPYNFYTSAHKAPLTPPEMSMREAVQTLGMDKHRFVHCRLKDGSRAVGGIVDIRQTHFRISEGIIGYRVINYSELAETPGRDPAVGEHFENGLKWTGLVGICIVLAPVAIAMIPLMFAGVLND